jgi:hypothetical protein
MPCNREKAQCFGGTCRLNLQGQGKRRARNLQKQAASSASSSLCASAGLLFGLLLDPEEEGDMFLQYIRLFPIYRVLQ